MPMESHFSTAGVSAGRQFQCFRDAICESVIRLGARRPRTGPFAAEIRASRFGPMRLTEVRCDAVTIERTRLDIARESGGVFYVTLQLAGVGRVVQRGREAHLRAGEFTVLDSTEPYALHFDAPVRRLVVEVPTAGSFQGRSECRDQLLAQPVQVHLPAPGETGRQDHVLACQGSR